VEPHKKSLADLFDQQRLHVVPLFQRAYVWSREKQWEPLWQDIADRALAVLEQVRSGQRQPLPAHFLGTIVTSQVRTYGREIDKRDVIDGQQRLTTLQVLLAAFRDLVAEHNRDLHSTLLRLTENSGVMSNPEETHKVWPTNADREVFKNVMTCRSPSALEERYPIIRRKYQRKDDPRPPLVEAYLFFHGAVGSFCSAGEESGEAVSSEATDALFEALRRHLQLVHIDLDDGDDPQVIFETLNARGEPLLPSDLIRNFLFLRATRQGKNVAHLYDTLWKDFDERLTEGDNSSEKRFWKTEERQGRYKRPRLDLFVFHYLQLIREREVAIGHLYTEFRQWWEAGGASRDVEAELREIRHNSDVFANLVVPTGNTLESTFAKRLKALDTSTVYPLTLFLFAHPKERVAADDLAGILTDISSYLVRRLITGATTKGYNRFFIALLAHIRPTVPVTRKAVRDYLAAAKGDSAWPDDKSLERAWLTLPVYEDIGAECVAMVLEALEQQLRTKKQEGVTIPALSIEHVMPQDWSTNWPLPPLGQGVEADQARWRRNEIIQTFGNLTLLTQQLNSAVSNGPYSKKRPEIAEQSELRLNTWFQTHLAWSEEAILERGRHLLDIAKQVWPGPS
jgi:hypothetical protein